MLRLPIAERPDWQVRAREYGFHFHTMHGQPYWDESAYYRFSLQQIEQDLEDPSAEIHQMCLDIVEQVVRDEALLTQCAIPAQFWQPILDSWQRRDPSLYSRLDFCYDGNGPAKLYENNADTPTSLYESGFWQWLWLEEQVDRGLLPRQADQYNSLQEKLIRRWAQIAQHYGIERVHMACCMDTDEDRGTVQYLQDCAAAAGIGSDFVYIEDIGLSDTGHFTDLTDRPIDTLFKLYPWEFMFDEQYGEAIPAADVQWIEPMWKAVLSNKALLPLLWQRFEGHPNLLPAWFEHAPPAEIPDGWVRKPLFSREGANITLQAPGKPAVSAPGPYGEEGYIYQAYAPLPRFGNNHTLIGAWLVDDQPAGISVREDSSLITQDLSRYLPHIIA
ncbi:glutathionylspermidine synthase family protein [Aestuariibacter halophilus]|uniref:Glutathionylspermidine synthase family protein n=1 Tax=Fluctibacter halophilus TaxID=226011 RepID=A0ABS8G467_9ALTE|nr:glutathionylspermidine synthase family protein [Aestuariibacter halophilus]MCC2614921.1 glutathionylspermidine synthase family protein [Aestuariibacter halophilus]